MAWPTKRQSASSGLVRYDNAITQRHPFLRMTHLRWPAEAIPQNPIFIPSTHALHLGFSRTSSKHRDNLDSHAAQRTAAAM